MSPYTGLTKTTGPTLGGQKPKGRKNSPSSRKEFNFPSAWEKKTSSTIT